MALPSLKQSVVTLPLLWLINAKMLNCKKPVLSNQFKIKHTKLFFRLSDQIVCLFFNSSSMSDICAVILCSGLEKLHHRLREKYIFTFTWTLWPGFVVVFAFLTNKEFLVQQPAHDVSLINSHDSHETLL